MATNLDVNPENVLAVVEAAETLDIELVVVGPEVPLAGGVVDQLVKRGIPAFGPSQAAAQLESSKAFAREIMEGASVPAPAYHTFHDYQEALNFVRNNRSPVVVKADGLAAGKAVSLCYTSEEAAAAVHRCMQARDFGDAGDAVVIEEMLQGREVSVFAFTDGENISPLIAACDYKRIGDGDEGPNTGGMGAYAPAPLATPALRYAIMRDVLHPAIEGLSRVGSPFFGVLYAGIMVKDGTPYVLEFNARFGDPETQVVLPLLKTDLAEVLEAVVEHRLDQVHLEWAEEESAVCVVLASGGYPGKYAHGLPIAGLQDASDQDRTAVFHAGTAWNGQDVVTAGGRVLGVTAWGASLRAAHDRAYEAGRNITFEGQYFRTDIAGRVLT
jgi:phosphoribosylamine--glycine ligase